ncbi:MAG: phasin family protein [bacterium]
MESQSILKKTMLASLGIYSLTKEKAQDIMNDLVKRGELSEDEGPKFVKAIMDRADEEVTHLKKLVEKQVNQTISKIKPSYEEEFKKLHQKIDRLTKEVEKLTK